MRPNIFITGFSGSGKTTVGREVARRMGWRFVDTDEEIVGLSGKSIHAIFNDEGEAGFRRMERQRLAAACDRDRQVVSTGGGIVADERNRQLMERNGVVVCLEARPDTILARLTSQIPGPGGPTVRPMLAAPDPLERIVALKSQRQADYSLAHWTVHTDRLSPSEAAAEVLRAWRKLGRCLDVEPGNGARDLAAIVRTSSRDYPVWVGWGTIGGLGDRIRSLTAPRAAYVVADEAVRQHARRAQVSMEAAGIPSHLFLVPPGEQSKNLSTARLLYEWLAGRKAERGDLIVAVGGGVVGDLAGFVAATYLRGISFGQVPTSLLAMLDASIGGKTGVDLPQGKNLVGAFHQPRFVLMDIRTLESLPRRELTSGWAEAIKHGLIMDEALLRTFEEDSQPILSLEREAATGVIRRSVAIKADVVSRDEKETLGVRVRLNYGHTIGHAIEAATRYGTFLHGEAVSLGMMGAALVSQKMGMLSRQDVERQRSVLETYGLPVSSAGFDAAAVCEAMTLDKKTSGGSVHWVLLERIGRAVTRGDVPMEMVRDVVESLR